jgi:uncharacterized protein
MRINEQSGGCQGTTAAEACKVSGMSDFDEACWEGFERSCAALDFPPPDPHRLHEDMPRIVGAVYQGNVEELQALLAGTSANEEYEGASLLGHAAAISSLEVIQVLLKHGAEVNSYDSRSGTTPLMAATHREVEVVQALLDAGAEVNARNAYGCTALIYAARVGSPEVVELLLQAGADPRAITHLGETAPGDAIEREDQAVIGVLAIHGGVA